MFEMYIRTPTVITLEQKQGCAFDNEWKNVGFTVYDAPNLEIYVGRCELEDCVRVKKAWIEIRNKKGKACPREVKYSE